MVLGIYLDKRSVAAHHQAGGCCKHHRSTRPHALVHRAAFLEALPDYSQPVLHVLVKMRRVGLLFWRHGNITFTAMQKVMKVRVQPCDLGKQNDEKW